MTASFHAVGKIPELYDWLKSSRGFSLAESPRCWIISIQTPSSPGATFVSSLLIASLSSAVVNSVVMVEEVSVRSWSWAYSEASELGLVETASPPPPPPPHDLFCLVVVVFTFLTENHANNFCHICLVC